MSNELTGAEIAVFDQAWAHSLDIYSRLVESYRRRRQQDIADGIPEAVTIVTMSIWLADEWEPEALSSALSTCVVLAARLMEDMGE